MGMACVLLRRPENTKVDRGWSGQLVLMAGLICAHT